MDTAAGCLLLSQLPPPPGGGVEVRMQPPLQLQALSDPNSPAPYRLCRNKLTRKGKHQGVDGASSFGGLITHTEGRGLSYGPGSETQTTPSREEVWWGWEVTGRMCCSSPIVLGGIYGIQWPLGVKAVYGESMFVSPACLYNSRAECSRKISGDFSLVYSIYLYIYIKCFINTCIYF